MTLDLSNKSLKGLGVRLGGGGRTLMRQQVDVVVVIVVVVVVCLIRGKMMRQCASVGGQGQVCMESIKAGGNGWSAQRER